MLLHMTSYLFQMSRIMSVGQAPDFNALIAFRLATGKTKRQAGNADYLY